MQHVFSQSLCTEMISWQALFTVRLSYAHGTYGEFSAGGPGTVHLGQRWGASQLQRIARITSRRLSQYSTPAKKTLVTCDINNGLWSGRGLMLSNSLTALALWGLWVPRWGNTMKRPGRVLVGWSPFCSISNPTARQCCGGWDPEQEVCHQNMAPQPKSTSSIAE